jgi:hypothetical protein
MSLFISSCIDRRRVGVVLRIAGDLYESVYIELD